MFTDVKVTSQLFNISCEIRNTCGTKMFCRYAFKNEQTLHA